MFSKKATKIDEIFTVDLTQIDGEDFVAFLENINFKERTITYLCKYIFIIFWSRNAVTSQANIETIRNHWLKENECY